MNGRTILGVLSSATLGAGIALTAIGIGQKLHAPEITEPRAVAAGPAAVATSDRPARPDIVAADLDAVQRTLVVLPQALPEDPNSADMERKRLARLAEAIIPHGRVWQAEHGNEGGRTQARMLLAKMERYDSALDAEPRSGPKTTTLISRLDRILADSETHVQDALCGDTICRAELIHETDVVALDFRPEQLSSAYAGMAAEIFMDRSDEDGRLKHSVYFRSPEAVSKEEHAAFMEMERQRLILANGGKAGTD